MAYNTLRCVICNKTNNLDVTSVPEEYLKGNGTRFRQESEHKHGFVCFECDDTIRNMYNEYEIEDSYNKEEPLNPFEMTNKIRKESP